MRERETRRERVVDAADSLAHEGRRDELVERVAMQEESLQPEMTPMDGVGRLSVVWSPAATTPMLGVGRSSVFWSPVATTRMLPEAPTGDLLSGSEMKERETRRERVGDEADSLAREEQHDGRAELVELQEQLVHKEREGRGRGRHSGG